MTKHKFKLPNSELTSIVMDEAEFEALVKDIETISLPKVSPEEAKRQLGKIREAKNLPMLVRGSLTNFIFKKLEVDTDMFCACVRGLAEKVLGTPEDVVSIPESEAIEQINKHYDSLPQVKKDEILKATDEIKSLLSEGKSPEDVLNRFVRKHLEKSPRRLRIDMIEQTAFSFSVTMINRIQVLPDPLGDIDGYICRLLTGVLITGELTAQEAP